MFTPSSVDDYTIMAKKTLTAARTFEGAQPTLVESSMWYTVKSVVSNMLNEVIKGISAGESVTAAYVATRSWMVEEAAQSADALTIDAIALFESFNPEPVTAN